MTCIIDLDYVKAVQKGVILVDIGFVRIGGCHTSVHIEKVEC